MNALRIGQFAKAVGVNIQTIRYYERRGLLTPGNRRASRYRLYGPDELLRLRFIKNAQALGFTLKEIADLLSLRVSSVARCGDVKRKALSKLQQVKSKVRDLQALAYALDGLITACEGGQTTDDCPILMSLERRGNDDNHTTTR